MKTNTAMAYIAGIEKRHNMSAEARSCGTHCEIPKAGDVAVGENYPVHEGDGGMAGKGGRGAGQGSKSNKGPSADTY